MADALVTVSNYDAEFALASKYQRDEGVLVIENALEERFIGLQPDLDRKPVLGYCGHWLGNKGARAMEVAIPKLLEGHPKLTVILVGVEKEFAADEIFPKKMTSRIEVIPFMKRSSLIEAYQKISILLLPSKYESFGLAGAEGMACGCALAATLTGFAAGLDHRKEFYRIESSTPDAIVDAVEDLLGNDALRQSIARGGYARVQNLEWHKSIEKLENFYRAILLRQV